MSKQFFSTKVSKYCRMGCIIASVQHSIFTYSYSGVRPLGLVVSIKIKILRYGPMNSATAFPLASSPFHHIRSCAYVQHRFNSKFCHFLNNDQAIFFHIIWFLSTFFIIIFVINIVFHHMIFIHHYINRMCWNQHFRFLITFIPSQVSFMNYAIFENPVRHDLDMTRLGYCTTHPDSAAWKGKQKYRQFNKKLQSYGVG